MGFKKHINNQVIMKGNYMKKTIIKKALLIALAFTLSFTVTVNSAFAQEQVSSAEISSVKGWDTNLQTNESKLWINEANFPDPIFRQYVLDNFDKDHNGYIGYPEILEYKKIYISNEPELYSLQGIEYFQNLRDLNCSYTSVSAIPADSFEFLEYFYCMGTKITSLDVSKCTRLKSLDCSQTPIAAVDVSNCTQLTFLSVSNTNVSSLDVSRLKALQYLQCSAAKISNLDVSNNPELLVLYCAATQITVLNLSNQPKLINLDVSETNISDLDLTQNLKLQQLDCSRCNFRELDLTKHTALNDVFCAQNPLLCVNLPDNFSGNFREANDNIETLYLASPAAETIDLRQYAPSIQAEKITDLRGASINGTTLTNLKPGHIVSYTYQCGGGKTLYYSFIPNYKTGLVYAVTPDTCTLNGSAAAAAVNNESLLDITTELSISEATGGILYLKTGSSQAVTTTVTLPVKLVSMLSNLTDGVQAQTDHGTYPLSPAQLKAILSASAPSSTVDIAFSKSDTGTDLIHIKGSKKEGYLVGTIIKPSPADSSVSKPSSSKALRAGVKKTTIKVTSSVGKRYIKLRWKKSAGYKVDYYEVFRSTKKNSGYGRKPFYRTSSGSKTTYKNTKALKKGTRYYFKVRGVRLIDNKKVYTNWSNKTWRIAK